MNTLAPYMARNRESQFNHATVAPVKACSPPFTSFLTYFAPFYVYIVLANGLGEQTRWTRLHHCSSKEVGLTDALPAVFIIV